LPFKTIGYPGNELQMKTIAALLLILSTLTMGLAQSRPRNLELVAEGVRIEPDKRLTVVLASLEAAGLQLPLTEEGGRLRERLAADFASLDRDLVSKMRYFVDQYRKRHPERSESELVAPFISMAFALSPVPDLAEPARDIDLPGDLLEVLDFAPLIRQFHRSSVRTPEGVTTVGQRLESLAAQYRTAADRLNPSAAVMIRDVVDYLHTRPKLSIIEQKRVETKASKGKKSVSRIETRERERRFFIIPEFLAAEGTVNFRNIRDDYHVVVPPGVDVSESEVRRAYFQFVLDPIILATAREILDKRNGIRALIDETRKADADIPTDVVLATSRSVVAAADIRERAFKRMSEAVADARRNTGKPPVAETVDERGRKVVQLTEELYLVDGRFVMPGLDDEVALQLSEAYESGAVLAFYFADQLKGLEESGFDIATSLRDMIVALDPAKEADRISQNATARRRAVAARDERRKAAVTILDNPVTKRLIEVETLIERQNFSGAETALRGLRDEAPADARIYYALGRVKSLEAASITDVERRNVLIREAKGFYDEVLRLPEDKVDPALRSLTFVKVAQLFEYYDQNEYAVKIYEAAIKIGNVKGGAYQEAVEARERLLKNQ